MITTTINCAEEQPHSYKETCNSIAFDGVRPCECECHTGQNIIHFVECCHPGLARQSRLTMEFTTLHQ